MTQYDYVAAGYGKTDRETLQPALRGLPDPPGAREGKRTRSSCGGLRTARIARERAQALIFDEPWHAVTPIPGAGPGYLIAPLKPGEPVPSVGGKEPRTP